VNKPLIPTLSSWQFSGKDSGIQDSRSTADILGLKLDGTSDDPIQPPQIENPKSSIPTATTVVGVQISSVQPIITQAPDVVIPSTNLHITGCTCSSCALPPVDPNRVQNQPQNSFSSVSAALDLNQTFSLNSLAAANQTIYLDFNGHTTSGTEWNTYSGLTNIVTPAFDLDGNTASFSSTELERIQYIWQRVAEDFSPFNVNVTTQAPTDINDLIKSGTSDTRWGVRVAIGGSYSDWFGSSAGGVAYVGSFNWNTDTPTFVFENNLGNGNEKYTADAIVHEVGHTLGLSHDGRITPAEGYYLGHGSGETGWAPVMGVGYYQNLVQWSKGQYASANNTEDDLAIITTQNGFGYRADDTGNTIATAKALTTAGTSVSGSGIIEQNTDVDFYSFFTGAGLISLTVNPFSRGPNLDILAELYNSGGTLIASSNPTELLSASIATTVAAGTYYLKIDGVGKGDPLTTGYTDYGSLGQYSISGNVVTNQAPTAVTLSNTIASLIENTSTVTNIKVADIAITDDGIGTNNLTVSGTDASFFEIISNALYLKAGTALNYEAKTSYNVNIDVDDSTVGSTPDATTSYSLNVLDVGVLSINNVSIVEGDSGTSNATFTVSLTDPFAGNVTVNYATVDGTAYAGYDFIATSGSLTFAPGQTTKTVNVAVIGDVYNEINETFNLQLSNPSNATLTNSYGTATIIDNDTLPSLSINNISVVEGNSGTRNASLSVKLSSASGQPVTVNYTTANGTAIAGSDYTSASGILTFAPGNTSLTIDVPILGDTTAESNETFVVNLTNANGAILATNQGTVTILDDDTSPNPTLTGTSGDDVLTGGDGNDNIFGLVGNDTVNGGAGNDSLTGGLGADILTGGLGADSFIYNNFGDSLFGATTQDRIRDFNPGAGDRIFLNNLPTATFNAGIITAGNLNAAVIAAYGDADPLTAGAQALAVNQAVFFSFGATAATRRTYLSVNDSIAGFNASNDLFIEVTGLVGTLPNGTLTTSNYFNFLAT
jgi:hypothetical protein